MNAQNRLPRNARYTKNIFVLSEPFNEKIKYLIMPSLVSFFYARRCESLRGAGIAREG